MIRRPAVAGQFYPGSKEALKNSVYEYLQYDVTPKDVLGLAAPHAGYIYSGPTAGKTYASANIPKNCIILSPNHTGLGAKAAIMSEGTWSTPIDDVPINSDLANLLKENSEILTEDSMAHIGEHSLEVQLPFLQIKQPLLSIVPICLGRLSTDETEVLGKSIAKAIKSYSEDVLIVASTDMNHYESHETTIEKDKKAIEKFLELNPTGLLETCADNNITMCGVIPSAVMINASKELGATNAELVDHTTSGETSGDYNSVVGYAGFIVY